MAGLAGLEQEVIRHLADGWTNREIAAALFLSTRAVDMQVRNPLTTPRLLLTDDAVHRAVKGPADR